MPAGSQVHLADLAQLLVPEQLVTGSNVKPDSEEYVLDHRLTEPVAAGVGEQLDCNVAKGAPIFWTDLRMDKD